MSLYHAVALVDHQFVEILQFGSEHFVEQKVHEHLKFTRQHGSIVRTEHEFFSEVCNAFEDITEILVVGGHTALADFRHFADKHRPLTAGRIVGYEVVDHPSVNQLLALARKYFVKYDQMVGIRVPT